VRRLAVLLPAVAGACAVGRRRDLPGPVGMGGAHEEAGAVELAGPAVRVALATTAASALVGGTGAWRVLDDDGRGGVVLRGAPGERWRVEPRDGRLRVVRGDGAASGWRRGPLVVRPVEAGALVALAGRRYRGELVLAAAPDGDAVLVVNRLPLEDYLRGVVPLEIGNRPAAELAAAEAQAVAARSYARARLRDTAGRDYDLGVGTMDQVYGGVEAERAVTDEAVARTAGLVLLYGARQVSAPYHSTCGGSTAEATEVWRSRAEPHLQRVRDVDAGGRAYCQPSSRFRWTRTYRADELRRLLDRHLGAYASVPAGGVGEVRALRVEEETPSGRVGVLAVEARRGTFRLRGNDVRFVLRAPGGEILESTYFSVRRPPVRRGESEPVATLEGGGYGHGVGMCQWGAIGRARAGHDFRAILRTYYPGTSVGYAD
jgi:stage II sporulation protein D